VYGEFWRRGRLGPTAQTVTHLSKEVIPGVTRRPIENIKADHSAQQPGPLAVFDPHRKELSIKPIWIGSTSRSPLLSTKYRPQVRNG